MSIFELVDSTDEENYYTLGLWPTLEEARAALDECEDPSDLNSDAYHDDYCRVEIRERKIGWSGIGKKVFEQEWANKYSEDGDENLWEKSVNGAPVIPPLEKEKAP